MAEDAIPVKTDGLEIEQSLAKIMGIVRAWWPREQTANPGHAD